MLTENRVECQAPNKSINATQNSVGGLRRNELLRGLFLSLAYNARSEILRKHDHD